MISGILFDKDGTLLDFEATWMPAFREIALTAARGDAGLAARLLGDGGYDAEASVIRSGSLFAAGNTAQMAKSWAPVVADYFRDRPLRDEMTAMIDDVFTRQSGRHTRALFDVARLFTCLRENNIAVGIATSDSVHGLEATLKPLDIAHLIDFKCGYDSGFGYKPEPGMVEAFCAATGVSAAETAIVGDNPHDMEMGCRAGVGMRVGVLSGNSSTEELGPHADEILNSAEEIPVLLKLSGWPEVLGGKVTVSSQAR